jgi:hypothetical protein
MGTPLSRHLRIEPLSSYFKTPDSSEQKAGIPLSNGRAVSRYFVFGRLFSPTRHPPISKAYSFLVPCLSRSAVNSSLGWSDSLNRGTYESGVGVHGPRRIRVGIPRKALIQNALPCFAPRRRTTRPPTIIKSLRVSGSESPRNGAQP